MRYLFTTCALAALLAPGIAQAASVYSGCAATSVKAGHNTFYVDPVNGSSTGDGSAAKPWHTLAEVLDKSSSLVATQGHNARTWSKGDTALVDVNTKGKIKPGDVIMLMSGDHGSFTIFNNYNSDFITVMAAPGQTPVVDKMTVLSSGKWLFQGIKFQGEQPTGSKGVTALVGIGYGDWLGRTQNIVLDNNSFSAADDSSSWSAEQWLALPYNYSLYLAPKTTCVSVTNNHFYNVMNAIAEGTDNSLIQGNLIERMANDGIDMQSSNLLIKGNTIRDGANNAAVSPLHADAIQGWSQTVSGQTLTNKNVVIDSNTVIKTGVTSLSYLQGISIFNGLWDGLTISNNMIVTNAYHGIALYGGANATIVNNTVLASNPKYGTWIMVNKGGGQPAKNVVVRNNISTALQIVSPNVTVDHNITGTTIAIANASGVVVRTSTGSDRSGNRVFPSILDSFVTINNSSETYDLRPKSSSPALAFGTATDAPLLDIIGKLRKPTVTAGAYN